MRVFILLGGFVCLALLPLAAAGPTDELKSFSSFEELDFEKLVVGDIFVHTVPMSAGRILSTESCFILKAKPSAAAGIFQNWDSSHHEELKVFDHRSIQSPPSSDDFEALDLNTSGNLFHHFVRKTEKTTPNESEIYFSKKEMELVSHAMKAEGEPAQLATAFWRKILIARCVNFQKNGFSGIVPYESRDTFIDPAAETLRIVENIPQIAKHFHSLLSQTLLSKSAVPASLHPRYYWEMLELNSHLDVDLGVTCSDFSDRHMQMLDGLFYASRDIFASFTLRQLWQVKIHDQVETLVWQGDFVSTGGLEDAKGIERLGAESMMRQEVKEQIQFLREDLSNAQ